MITFLAARTSHYSERCVWHSVCVCTCLCQPACTSQTDRP